MTERDADADRRIGEAIVAQARLLHLGQHLGSRFWQVVSPLGAASTPGRRALALGWSAIDLGTSRWLAVPRRNTAAAIAIDLIDQAMWSALAADEPESSRSAMIPGASLSAELGARHAWRALALPLAHAGVAATVRHRRGHRLRVGQIGWQVWGIVGSVGLGAMGSWRRQRALQHHLERLEPALVAAEIAGMNEVGVVADNVLDSTQRATVLIELSLGAHGAFVGALDAGALKQGLADRTRAVGGYLGDVLAAWQAVRNSGADLSLVVRFDLDTADALRTLSGAQAAELSTALDTMDLRGVVPVSYSAGGVVRVNGVDIRLTEAPPVPSLFFDPLPMALAMNAAWMAAPTGAARDHVRWSHAGAPVAISAAAAAVAAARAGQSIDRDRAHRAAAVGASGIALLLYSLLSPRGARNPYTPEGVQRYPFTQALQGYLMVLKLAERDLSRNQRVAAWTVAAGSMVMGLAASRRPRTTRQLLAELVWPITTALSSAALAESISADSATIRTELEADDTARLAAARSRGRDRMLALVAQSIDEADNGLLARLGELDSHVAIEARRRIDAARTDLAAARASI